MQLGIEYLILVMCVCILIRIFLETGAVIKKNRLIPLSITEVLILILFNTIMYIGTDGIEILKMDYPPTYFLIAIIIFINVFLIYQLIKRIKRIQAQAT